MGPAQRLNQETFPVVYHLNMHNLYIPEGAQPESFFYYDYALGEWFWTSPAYWPFLYQFAGGNSRWLYYFTNTASPSRWYYNPNTGGYLFESQL